VSARGSVTRATDPPAAGHTAVRTTPFGGDALVAAALGGTTPAGWYGVRPRSPRAWSARIEAVRAAAGGSAWLDALWPAIDATGPAAERLRRAAAGGVVITSGQQPGLFGGPIYAWSKAVGALALADALERECGVPVAPLFWAATDDSDFEEASTTWVPVVGGAQSLTVRPTAAQGTVLASALLGDVGSAMADLVAASGSASYGAALDAVRVTYAAPRTNGDPPTAGAAYVALLRRILTPLGIAVLDASHGAVRRRAFPVLMRALERADAVREALVARARDIAAAGFHPKVREVGDLSLVFSWSARAGGSVESDGPAPLGAARARVPRSRAREVAAAARPGTLSGNVLLRPVVERALVPTVAYLAGPGEITYFAQTSAVAQALDVEAPLAVPRWSCTLIEPSVGGLLERYGITLEELANPHGPETRMARAAIPASVRGALDALRAAVEQGVDVVAAADADGLLPATAVRGARAHLLHRLARLERRYTAAAKLRQSAALRDVATVRGALLPDGRPQERRLNFIPFLARSGPGLLDAMRTEAARHAAALVGDESSATR
jgi:bacillithiol synthase